LLVVNGVINCPEILDCEMSCNEWDELRHAESKLPYVIEALSHVNIVVVFIFTYSERFRRVLAN